ncbi:MAG TPA: hypothetical protein VMR88_06460 [Candidatus Polarisedimenticolaceae bacterium]|nr:hypothetical protein [Candidatus Polarisedimenticolaceae bacterium]
MAGGMKIYVKHRFPGRLFIVEGIDGSGKSTQLMLLQKWLEAEGYRIIQRMEFVTAGSRGHQAGQEKEDAHRYDL